MAMRLLIASTLLATLAMPALADDTTGTVVAFDRVSNVLVLDDRSVWNIPAEFPMPDDLVAGDVITIDYQSNGDSGVGKLLMIKRAES